MEKGNLFQNLFSCFWGLFLCATPFGVPAQEEKNRYIITQYTTENGLPQNSIKGIEFDTLGYVWIGTENGLIKYDGIRFNIWDSYDVAPTSARVKFIRKNKRGEILIDFGNREYYKIQFSEKFGTRPVRMKNNFLVGAGGSFLEIAQPPSRFLFESIQNNLNSQSSEYFITDQEQMFFRSGDTVFCIDGRRRIKKIIVKKKSAHAPLLLFDQRLVMPIGRNTAIQLFGPEKHGEILRIEGALTKIAGDRLTDVQYLQAGAVVYGIIKGELYKLTYRDGVIQSTLLLTGLNTVTLSNVSYDEKTGNYYLQSKTDGLYVVKPKRFQTISIPNGQWNENSFYGQHLAGRDSILANGFLFTFPKDREKPSLKKILSFADRHSGTLKGKDFYYRNDFLIRKHNLTTGAGRDVANVDGYISCFRASPFDSVLYFSTDGQIYSLIGNVPVLKLKIPKTIIYGFTFADERTILIPAESGLWRGDLVSGKVELLVKGYQVRNVYQDKEGYLWLGTYNSGIVIYRNGKTWQCPIDDQKRLSVINSIFEDNLGRIWFSTNNGLLATRRKSLIDAFNGLKGIEFFAIYDKTDGLVTNEFNGGAFPDKVYLSDGRISIPGLKGLVVFNPDSIPDLTPLGKLFIGEIRIDDQLVDNKDNISLNPEYRIMTVSLTTPWTTKAESLHFEWCIAGDKRWNTLRYDEPLQIRNYENGNYRILMRIQGYPDSEISLNFSVMPFFYETIWFRLAVALFLAFLVFLAFKSAIASYKKQNMTLDRKVKEKTQELNESIAFLNTTVEHLKIVETQLELSVDQKDRIIHMLLHDMKSPLFSLKNGIEELDRKLVSKAYPDPEIIRKSNTLREGINDVYSFSVNFFEWIQYQKEGIKANYQPTRLADIFNRIIELYSNTASRKGITLIAPATDIVLVTDENILTTILRNVVDNALKYTASGFVRVIVCTNEEEYVSIQIEDSGPGIPESLLEKINEAAIEGRNIEDHSRFGYRLILHLIRLIQGNIELKNRDGLSVRIILNFIPFASKKV